MRARGFLGAAVLGVTVLGGLAHAGNDAAPAPGAGPESSVSSMVLTIRARALGLETAPFGEPSNSLGLEPAKAPTGAGSIRMPSATTEVARGVYLTVMPSCQPGVDDLGLSAPVRRRAQPLRSQ